jgi:hypothetical protein
LLLLEFTIAPLISDIISSFDSSSSSSYSNSSSSSDDYDCASLV